MNQQLPVKMSVEQFLAWCEKQAEGRYELVQGKVVMMAPERARHVKTKARVWRALEDATRQSKYVCHVFTDGIGVRVGPDDLREPDASVQVGGEVSDDAMVLEHPTILVEVLSPSSEHSDTGAKLEEYFSIASVKHYLIVNAERRSVIHHTRMEGGHIDTIVRTNGLIDFAPFDFSVSIAAFFGEVDR
jgi:Uma2 family endonuclease